MALVPNFSCSQNAGTPSTFTISDTSTGSDVAITQRRVYLLQANGTYLVPSGVTTDYIEWPIANSTISLDVLNQDTALEITVQWLNVSNVVVYDKVQSFGFDAFGQNFFYGLSDGQVPITNPPIVLSTSYYQNKVQFYCYLVSAAQAIAYASDIYRAQTCYDLDQAMINSQQLYF